MGNDSQQTFIGYSLIICSLGDMQRKNKKKIKLSSQFLSKTKTYLSSIYEYRHSAVWNKIHYELVDKDHEIFICDWNHKVSRNNQ